jgi:hypothetical protein
LHLLLHFRTGSFQEPTARKEILITRRNVRYSQNVRGGYNEPIT